MDVFRKMRTDPRVRVIHDDARRYLLRTNEKYDVMLLDPLRTRTAGSNNIYSQEFFNLLESHQAEDVREGIEAEKKTYLGDRAYIQKIARDYPINHDWSPVAEYCLGLD